ncbi:MAG: tRNA (adenosine(37)-N6)-dimethylallyltransferase MiaA [Smithellaceae bacterium]|nr:tRNA (adenosine(37)-N6)-dimethylallyltransferase MiaA [Smithellaceae bacterium]
MESIVEPKEKKPRLVVIQGPTAAGKSSLAITLARKTGGQIISADSMQVYRYLDIGTAKPARAEREEVIHHLIDIVNPDDPFHAGQYVTAAGEAISRLHEGNTPIFVVGGTGLYIKALLGGLFPSPEADENLRGRYRREAELFGSPYLYQRLKEKDPLAAASISERDQVRVIRALEVFESTGRSIRECQERHRFDSNRYDYLKLGITLDRESLYRLIDRRVDNMIASGLVEEVENLLARGYSPALRSMQSLGYRHMLNYLGGSWSLEEAIELMKRDTRHYAKRQLTWFRRDQEIRWFTPDEAERIASEVRIFLQPAGV